MYSEGRRSAVICNGVNVLLFIYLLCIIAVWVFMTLLPTLMLNAERRDVPVGARDFVGWGVWGPRLRHPGGRRPAEVVLQA